MAVFRVEGLRFRIRFRRGTSSSILYKGTFLCGLLVTAHVGKPASVARFSTALGDDLGGLTAALARACCPARPGHAPA